MSSIWCLARPFLLLASLLHVCSHVSGFSVAIQSDSITGVAFDVFWIRNSTDPTVYSLERQWMRPTTGEYEGGGFIANVSGTQGESLDTQSASLTVAEFGTFIMYGVVLDSTTTSTFYTSPSFTVLSPGQASETTLVTTEVIYLGTSFSVPPIATSATSSAGSLTEATTTALSSSNPSASAGSANSETSSSHSSNHAAIIGAVVGAILGALIFGACFVFYRRRRQTKQAQKDNTTGAQTRSDSAKQMASTGVPPSWLLNHAPSSTDVPFSDYQPAPAMTYAPLRSDAMRSSDMSWATSQAKSTVYPQSATTVYSQSSTTYMTPSSPVTSSIDYRGSIMAQYYHDAPTAPPGSILESTVNGCGIGIPEAPPDYDQAHFVLTPTPARRPEQ
ncbi:hypothetical protein FB446DRAFT_771411 [Lentinula raphanica]|nr:hypothetical protein FB446DRAFT_771411 [Lentinula raphanica]